MEIESAAASGLNWTRNEKNRTNFIIPIQMQFQGPLRALLFDFNGLFKAVGEKRLTYVKALDSGLVASDFPALHLFVRGELTLAGLFSFGDLF